MLSLPMDPTVGILAAEEAKRATRCAAVGGDGHLRRVDGTPRPELAGGVAGVAATDLGEGSRGLYTGR